MKRFYLCFFICILLTHTLVAQLVKPINTNVDFTNKLNTIALDMRNNYYSIQGEKLPSGEDVDVYASRVILPGSKHCTIYRYHSVEDTSASWQALIYEGDKYEEAMKAYKRICRDVDHCVIRLQSGAAPFTGKFEKPEAGLRFVTSSYKLKTKDTVYKNFYAEAEMVNINYDQWEVRLNLVCKKEDTEDEE